MAGVDRAIVHIPERQRLLEEICRVAVEVGGFKLAWIGMVAPDGSVQPVAQAGMTGYLDGIRMVTQDVPEGRGPVGTAIRENRPVVVEEAHRDPRLIHWHNHLRKFDIRYIAAFPIRVASRTAGSFQVYAPRSSFFDENEVKLLSLVSDDISFALTAISEQTARKEAEESLRRSESSLATFFNQAPIGLAWLSPEGTILRANQAQLDLLGRPARDYIGHRFTEFCEQPSDGLELLERLAAKQTVQNLRLALRCQAGKSRHVLVDGNPFWNDARFQYSSIFLRDITDRVALENEVLQISEREDQRIAHDIHDGLGQLLAGTAYLTSTLGKRLAAKSLPEARQMRRILKLMYEAVAQTRSLARGLHPVEPESNGLMVALESLARRTKSLFRIGCRFNCRPPVLIADNVTATHLYRIAQEATTNAIKHSKAGRIEISLSKTPERIHLEVTDNGAGMPAPPRENSGMGLRIMRYRAGMIGGSLAVHNESGGGTAIICTVPLPSPGVLKRRAKATPKKD
jgi:PAS domain S-box-containing protein